MKQWTNNVAPNWCKNAIATNRGWINPKTGDIEVATKFLDNPQDYDLVIKEIRSGTREFHSIDVDVQKTVKEDVKRGRGRPKLNKPKEVKIPRPRGRPKLSKNIPEYNPLEAMIDGI
jgi:hypothetical protein